MMQPFFLSFPMCDSTHTFATMIQINYQPPKLLFSSDVPDISITTDHAFADVQIRCNTLVLLSGRFYAIHNMVTVHEVAALVGHLFQNDPEFNRADITIEASSEGEVAEKVTFSVICCHRKLDLYEPTEWLAGNFLTTVRSRRIAPAGWLNLSWYAAQGESLTVYVRINYLDDDARPRSFRWLHSGASQTAPTAGIRSVYIRMEDIRAALIKKCNIANPTPICFTVECGRRRMTFYVDPSLSAAPVFHFNNCFNVLEQLSVQCVTTAKIKKDHAIALIGNEAQLYDVTLSKEYETQTGPLTPDECEQMEQMLTSNAVHLLFWKGMNWVADVYSMKPILITDFTSEISDGDDKLNTVKFTWRFTHNLPAANIPTTSDIFTATFNPTFS